MTFFLSDDNKAFYTLFFTSVTNELFENKDNTLYPIMTDSNVIPKTKNG